jgi:putative lipoprotein
VFHKAILSIFVLSLAVSPAFAAKVSLAGQVTYRERIALPENALLRIELVDETLPNAPPRVAVQAPIGPGQVPLSFNLSFEDTMILPNHSYALIADIGADGGTLFRNAEPYPVNPLAQAEPILIVTNLVAATSTEEPSAMSSEPASPQTPAIIDATWNATEINGAAPLPRSTTSLTIGSDMRAGGKGGCNSYFAQAQLDGESLHFGSVTSTMKGCTQGVNLQEKAYFDALAATAAWQVSGDELTLFGVDGKALLKFRR